MATLLKTRVLTAPRSVSFVIVSVGGLALFLMFASLLLISSPIGSAIHEYLQGIDNLRKHSLVLSSCENHTGVPFQCPQLPEEGNQGMIMGEFQSRSEMPNALVLSPPLSSDQRHETESHNDSVSIDGGIEEMEVVENFSSALTDDSKESDYGNIHDDGLDSGNLRLAVDPLPSPKSNNVGKAEFRICDLYHGKWIYDPAGPLYKNNTCPIIGKTWNCQCNGRPDKDYENWRWRPDQCDLPRFDARKFFELMTGKTLAFIGDSLARNQMESMLCILWQDLQTRQMIGSGREVGGLYLLDMKGAPTNQSLS